MNGTLYVTGTPIGNLGDISPRALEILGACDFIAAEDTRVTLKLLNHFGIKKPLVSYYEHNKGVSGSRIAERILSGESCALVTDAGMPAVSDPGEDLVRECRELGIEVYAVPGPCAFATALAVSGMPSGRFTFEGFLSVNKPGRKKHLESIRREERTMIFYEAPHKLSATLRDMYESLGDREIALVKELTKIHEACERTTLAAAAEKYSGITPKGEFVIIIAGCPPDKEKAYTAEDALEAALAYVKKGRSNNEAAKLAAADTGIKKNDIYKALLERG